MLKKLYEKKLKNRYLIYFVLFAYVFGSFLGVFSHQALATTGYVTLSDWDDVAAGLDSGTSGKIAFVNKGFGNYFETSSTSPLSPPNSFKMYGGTTGQAGSGYWNLTQSYEFIDGVNLSFYMTTNGVFDLEMKFYDYQAHNVMRLKFHVSTLGADYIQWYDDSGYQTLYSQTSLVTARFYITITHTIHNYFNVKILNATFVALSNNNTVGCYPADYTNFSYVYSSASTYVGSYAGYYFDNFRIITTSGPPVTICGFDPSLYQTNSIGILDAAYFSSYKYLESWYHIPVTTTLFGVSLSVSNLHYLYAPTLSEYTLKINGVEVGNPECMAVVDSFPLQGDVYGLFWNVTVTIDNEPVLFEFYHSTALPTSPPYYWDVFRAESPFYFEKTLQHSNSGLYDGVYNGASPFTMYPVIRFYYNTFSFENETSPYSDLVTSSKTTFNTWETVPVYYFISDYTYTNTLQLWHNGTQMTTQGYPYTISSGDFNGELSFLPFQIGSYQFRLVRNSIVRSSFNFTVSYPADTDFILSPYPNPCMFNTPVSIFYRYYPDDGAEGFIGVSEFSDTSNTSSFDEFWTLAANTTGNKSFIPQTPTYVSLWKKTGSTYYRVAIVYLRMISPFDNTINAQYQSIILTDAYPSVNQRIYGTQNVQGFNTFIRLNGKVLQDVTDTSFYSLYTTITKAGLYTAELCMTTVNGTVVLASVNFTVTSSIGVGTGGGAEAFSPELKALFGICFVIVSVCVPLMISVKYHVNVPTFVYVIFMAFGIGLGTKLGFLDLWLVFLFVVALVAGAVYTIFGHGGPGPGTGSGGDRTIRERVFTRRGSDEGVRRNGR
jgi:hypothetical protein